MGTPLEGSREYAPGFNFSTPLDQLTPDELALSLGISTPGYDSNDKGSLLRNSESYLNKLTPDQLMKRYSTSGVMLIPGSSTDRAGYDAFNSFKSILGRAPTVQEFSGILPSFLGPNGAQTGNAALSNLYSQYKTNPTSDPSNPQSPLYTGSGGTAGDHTSDINGIFQSTLGRDATSDEMTHFKNLMQTGQTDVYSIGNALQQTTEYQNAADTKFRGQVSGELQGYDTEFFNKAKQDVIANSANNGLPFGTSSSLDSALASLATEQAANRGQWLSQLSASQYGGNKANAAANYGGALSQMYSNINNERSNKKNMADYFTERGFGGQDYSTQMNDYVNYLNNNQRRGANPIYGAVGGAVGAGAGAMTGNPALATAGYGIGSSLGNAYAYNKQGGW